MPEKAGWRGALQCAAYQVNVKYGIGFYIFKNKIRQIVGEFAIAKRETVIKKDERQQYFGFSGIGNPTVDHFFPLAKAQAPFRIGSHHFGRAIFIAYIKKSFVDISGQFQKIFFGFCFQFFRYILINQGIVLVGLQQLFASALASHGQPGKFHRWRRFHFVQCYGNDLFDAGII